MPKRAIVSTPMYCRSRSWIVEMFHRYHHDVQDRHEHADLVADHNHGDYDVEDLDEADVHGNHDADHLPMVGGQLERGLFTSLNGRDHLEIKFHRYCNLVDHEDRAVVDLGDRPTIRIVSKFTWEVFRPLGRTLSLKVIWLGTFIRCFLGRE